MRFALFALLLAGCDDALPVPFTVPDAGADAVMECVDDADADGRPGDLWCWDGARWTVIGSDGD